LRSKPENLDVEMTNPPVAVVLFHSCLETGMTYEKDDPNRNVGAGSDTSILAKSDETKNHDTLQAANVLISRTR
jgi:hypothetical protein